MSIIVDVDLRSSMGSARDQGGRRTCLAFAASAAHEASRTTNDYLSVEYLYYFGVQRSHRDPTRGLNEASVAAALKEDGQPVEPAWPYSLSTPDASRWRPPTINEPVHKSTIVFSSNQLSDVHTAILSSIPVLLLVAVTTAMHRPDPQGVVRPGSADTTTTRGHALLAVGSGHASDGRYLLVRNSWGLTWGDQGHAWLPDSYVATILRKTGIISSERQN